MAEFTVTSSELRNKAQELSRMNTQYKQEIDNLVAEEAALKSMWEGEAKEAFTSAFNRDKAKMDAFYSAIQDYIAKLGAIAAQYDASEGQNVATAGS